MFSEKFYLSLSRATTPKELEYFFLSMTFERNHFFNKAISFLAFVATQKWECLLFKLRKNHNFSALRE